ncbi:MAG: hypothetical protein A4E65_00823 [Syntrophorhabdus sp. PtaU1.Bin153]|nr:MAG: hypothetical protein A4E65_00823 [Syntrophorhabdus sp. PtaU1.Bin153]
MVSRRIGQDCQRPSPEDRCHHRKPPGLDNEERIGWEEIRRILDGEPNRQDLFEEYVDPPSWAAIDINRVSVERLRHFDDVYLDLLLWNKLGFAEFCRNRYGELFGATFDFLFYDTTST